MVLEERLEELTAISHNRSNHERAMICVIDSYEN